MFTLKPFEAGSTYINRFTKLPNPVYQFHSQSHCVKPESVWWSGYHSVELCALLWTRLALHRAKMCRERKRRQRKMKLDRGRKMDGLKCGCSSGVYVRAYVCTYARTCVRTYVHTYVCSIDVPRGENDNFCFLLTFSFLFILKCLQIVSSSVCCSLCAGVP